MQFSTEMDLGMALTGGVLIGLSAALLMLVNGRVAGISGIVGALVSPHSAKTNSNLVWRFAFLIAMIIGALVGSMLGLVDGQVRAVASLPMALVAGVLVGAGTKFGAGCTSGHGICGMSRFSKRSFVAVGIFMVTGFATASLIGFWS